MKFDVATFGSAFVDVYLKSKGLKRIKTSKVKTGKALCAPHGAKINVDELVIASGGGATNNAVSFERLGLQAACIACVGDDHWGLFIKKKLKSEGVSLLYLQQSDKSQTSYSNILVSSDGSRTILVYRGASNDLSWYKVDWDRLSARWFHVSSLGGDLALLSKILSIARHKNIPVSVNPGSGELKQKESFLGYLDQVKVLFVNKHEAANLTGVSHKNEKKIKDKLAKLGVEWVVMTKGRRGSVAIKKGREEECKMGIFKVETIEETGAGDAFGSGFVAGQLLGHSIKDSLKLGAANAASVTTKIGCKEGLLWAPEVASWLKKKV